MTPEFQKFYEYTTQRIKQETDLINNRLSWMLTFQGFLFASITLVLRKDTDQAVSSILKIMIPIIGIVVALLTLTGITAAYRAIRKVRLKLESNEQLKKEYEQYPPAYGDMLARTLGRVTSYGLPLSLAITWVILLKKLNSI